MYGLKFGSYNIASGVFDLTYNTQPEPSLYTLTLLTDGNGTLTADAITGYAGDTVTLSPTYNTYYRFSGYEVTGGTISDNTFTFGDSDATVKADFKVNSFTAKGNLCFKNLFSGSYQGAQTCRPGLGITAWNGVALSSEFTGGSYCQEYGASGTSKAANLTGGHVWKQDWTSSATCMRPPSAVSAWKFSAYMNVSGQHNAGAGYFSSSAERAMSAFVHMMGTGTARTFTSAASWMNTSTAYKTGSYSLTASAALVSSRNDPDVYRPDFRMQNYSQVTTGSAGCYSWAYNRVMGVAGTWSASGIAP